MILKLLSKHKSDTNFFLLKLFLNSFFKNQETILQMGYHAKLHETWAHMTDEMLYASYYT
jgi:hypothetical protein